MREFIVRARAAPVDPARFVAETGHGAHTEFLAQMIGNALFVSKGHRDDTVLTIVAESSQDYSRALTFDGAALGDLGGSDEASVLRACADALSASAGLGKEKEVVADNGIRVATVSFERLVRQRCEAGLPVFILDRKGEDIRVSEDVLAPHAVFLLTDHVPMPKKAFNSLKRLGVRGLSLGPLMLHGSQCITLIHNELDRA